MNHHANGQLAAVHHAVAVSGTGQPTKFRRRDENIGVLIVAEIPRASAPEALAEALEVEVPVGRRQGLDGLSSTAGQRAGCCRAADEG